MNCLKKYLHINTDLMYIFFWIWFWFLLFFFLLFLWFGSYSIVDHWIFLCHEGRCFVLIFLNKYNDDGFQKITFDLDLSLYFFSYIPDSLFFFFSSFNSNFFFIQSNIIILCKKKNNTLRFASNFSLMSYDSYTKLWNEKLLRTSLISVIY